MFRVLSMFSFRSRCYAALPPNEQLRPNNLSHDTIESLTALTPMMYFQTVKSDTQLCGQEVFYERSPHRLEP